MIYASDPVNELATAIRDHTHAATVTWAHAGATIDESRGLFVSTK